MFIQLTNNEIFEKNMNIVYYCYNQLSKNELIINSQEDILQDGFLALWRAICKFHDEDENKLIPYMFAAVKNQMLRWISKQSFTKDTISLESNLNSDNASDEITLNDVLPFEDTYYFDNIDEVIKRILEQYEKYLIKNHSRKHVENHVSKAKIILTELYIDEHFTAIKIESKHNINRTTVGIILKELRECLKQNNL